MQGFRASTYVYLRNLRTIVTGINLESKKVLKACLVFKFLQRRYFSSAKENGCRDVSSCGNELGQSP